MAQAAIVPEGSEIPELPPELAVDYVDPVTVDKAATFATGEKLKFRLGWSLFKVAKATLQVEPDSYNEETSLKISLEARTNSFADAFYKVRNLSTSWVADDMSRSFEYSAVQKEGERNRDTQALFDPVSLKARYKNNSNGEEIGPVDILPGTFDPLGIVFFVRCLDFEVGDRLVVPTSNGKEFFYTFIKVVKKVERRFSLGRYEAYVLEPDIKDIGGVFKRSKNGMIRFYFSADEQKLPLRMESEVAVGKFWAELVDVGTPEEAVSVAVAKID
ncbi:MAG: DUF3108 domain-containing protein [Puniceicoccaceae bacterium]